MMYDKIIRFIQSIEFRRRIALLDTFQNEEKLITMLSEYRVYSPGHPDIETVMNDLFSISKNYIENADFNNRFYIRVAVLIFCRYQKRLREIGKAEYEDALNTFKKRELLDEVVNLRRSIDDIKWQQQDTFKVMIGDKVVAFLLLKMNIPKAGDLIEIDYDKNDERLEQIKDFFEMENIEIINNRTQSFKYKVESVITKISSDDYDEVNYLVNVTPVI